jgi:hypothetical protein
MFLTSRFVGNGGGGSSLTNKESPMRKIIVGAPVSIDGVMQAPDGPVVLGAGKKLFADGSAPHSLKLTNCRISPNGLIVGHHQREGEIKLGDAALDSPSEREVARQERMKRES